MFLKKTLLCTLLLSAMACLPFTAEKLSAAESSKASTELAWRGWGGSFGYGYGGYGGYGYSGYGYGYPYSSYSYYPSYGYGGYSGYGFGGCGCNFGCCY